MMDMPLCACIVTVGVEKDKGQASAENIRQLKARYFRYLDLKDWPSLESLFTPDVVVDFRMATGQAPDETALFQGVQRFITFAQEGLHQVATIHHGYMPEISIISPVRAYGIWAMEDILSCPAEGASPRRIMHGYGHYEDIYEQTNGNWLIQTMKLTRLRVDVSTAP